MASAAADQLYGAVDWTQMDLQLENLLSGVVLQEQLKKVVDIVLKVQDRTDQENLIPFTKSTSGHRPPDWHDRPSSD